MFRIGPDKRRLGPRRIRARFNSTGRCPLEDRADGGSVQRFIPQQPIRQFMQARQIGGEQIMCASVCRVDDSADFLRDLGRQRSGLALG